MRGYLRHLLRTLGGRVWLTLALSLAVTLFEAVTLLLLVPLLALAGVRLGGATGRIAASVHGALAAMGVHPTLAGVLAVFVLVAAARAGLAAWQQQARVAVQEGFVLALRRQLYHAVSHSAWVFYTRQRAGDLAHALTAETERLGVATSALVMLLTDALVAAAYVAIALRVSPGFTVLSLAAGVVLVLLLRSLTRRAQRYGRDLSARYAGLFSATLEHLGGMKSAKGFGAEDRHAALYGELAEGVSGAYERVMRAHALGEFWRQLGSATFLSAILYVAIARLRLPAAEVLLLLFLFSRIVPRVASIQSGYQRFVADLPAYERVAALIARFTAQAEPPQGGEPLPLGSGVRLDGISFTYPGAAWPALGDVTLAVPAGRTTAVVGASGAGKSTVVDLLMGLLTPDAGAVRVDGVPLEPPRAAAWRRQIGYVPQDTFLFHDTVRANLLWAHPVAGEDDLWEALRLAAADEFVRRLPQGLDTVVGDRGARLSGGERQRLALARALLRRPALLILDEATSALDAENEERILRAIAGLHGAVTIVTVSHRLSAVRGADCVHVLDGGRLAESGTWTELMAHPGRLRALFEAQQHAGGDGRVADEGGES